MVGEKMISVDVAFASLNKRPASLACWITPIYYRFRSIAMRAIDIARYDGLFAESKWYDCDVTRAHGHVLFSLASGRLY